MIILVDIGNTTIEFAIFKNNKIEKKYFVPSKPFASANIKNYLEKFKINSSLSTTTFIVSSVVPEINPKMEQILKLYSTNIKFLEAQDFINIVKTDYNIEKVGKDILCKTAWVSLIERKDTIILDIGTATVLQYVKTDGYLVGAAITTGLSTTYKALNNLTSLLPLIEPKETEFIFGKNTIECIENGVFWGYIGCVNKLIEKAIEETNCKNIYLTGGLSHIIMNYLDFNLSNNKNIIFEAILAVYNNNLQLNK